MSKGYYVIEYDNGYVQCDEVRYVHGTYSAAEAYAEDTIEEYGEQYEYLVDDEEVDTDEYYANCSAYIHEATEEEIAEEDFEEI